MAHDDPPAPRKVKGQTERLPIPGAEPPIVSDGAAVEDEYPPVSMRATVPSERQPEFPDIDEVWNFDEPLYEDLTGLTLGGRYQLEAHLANGGMGSIYRGTHAKLSMPIAVKVMLPSMSYVAGYARRFRREARVMSVIQHRNIVRVIDYGIESERPYIVMEMLDGQSMAEWLDSRKALPTLAEVDELIRQVLDGLDAAHSEGVVHRDLKPDNIFLSVEADGERIVKLLDFGLAHLQDPTDQGPTLTKHGMVSGTPEYMSPEQCQSLSVGPRADIYAVGCILTELLQWFPPFQAESHMLVMSHQMFMEPPDLKRPEGAEPIPPLLERLRRDMLAKDPEQRPATVAELRQRWLEAMNAQHNAQAFPGRKEHVFGGRAERQPKWTGSAVVVKAQPQDTGLIKVAWVELDGDGVDDTCIVGMASGGALVTRVPLGDALPADTQALVLDAGKNVDAACAWLSGFNQPALPRPLVCIDTGGDQVGRLIAAGAGDLVNYPATASTVLRRLRKLLKRFRRATRA